MGLDALKDEKDVVIGELYVENIKNLDKVRILPTKKQIMFPDSHPSSSPTSSQYFMGIRAVCDKEYLERRRHCENEALGNAWSVRTPILLQ